MLKKFTFASLLFCFQACFAYDKFVIHAIPKCGTHFLQATITELVGVPTLFTVRPSFAAKIKEAENKQRILRLSCAFNPSNLQILRQQNYKLISIYRDPRDALLSLAVYMRSLKGRGVKRDFFEVVPNFDDLSFSQQLLSLMNSKNNYFKYYFARLNWHIPSISYGVKYENLVGSQGGGDDALQVQEILNIANHINLPITFEEAQEVASKIYRSSGVEMIEGKEFVHGKIGSWKKFMHPIHKDIFKEQFGDLLITLGYENDKNW